MEFNLLRVKLGNNDMAQWTVRFHLSSYSAYIRQPLRNSLSSSVKRGGGSSLGVKPATIAWLMVKHTLHVQITTMSFWSEMNILSKPSDLCLPLHSKINCLFISTITPLKELDSFRTCGSRLVWIVGSGNNLIFLVEEGKKLSHKRDFLGLEFLYVYLAFKIWHWVNAPAVAVGI